MELSDTEVLLLERINNLTAEIEAVRQERGVEEARASVIRSWIDYHVSLGRFYGLVDITRALEGTSDFERFKSTPSDIPGQFTLAKLIACGVSDEGLTRVIIHARPLDSSYSYKPCRRSDCKGRGCRLWPAPSAEEVGRAYKNWCDGTGARWQNA